MSDDSPTSTPEKKHKFGFRFLGGGGKKKKSSTTDLAAEALEGAVGGESKSSLADDAAAIAAAAAEEEEKEVDPLFKLLNEGKEKRNFDRKLSKQKTLSDCEED